MGKQPFPVLEVSGASAPVKTDYQVSAPQSDGDAVPVRFKEVKPNSLQPQALQLALVIPEGTNISLLRGGQASGPPNCFLVCKLSFVKPHPHTPVQWKSRNPQFLFKQVWVLWQWECGLTLSPSLPSPPL